MRGAPCSQGALFLSCYAFFTMAIARTIAILRVLSRGREPKIAPTVLKVFGASSFEEALVTYDAVGAAERASIDEMVERVTANAGAAFWLGVDREALG